jgi:hypothetical protein
MKTSARLEQLLEKYELTAPFSYFVKRKIFKSKQKILSRILKLEKYNSVFVSAAVYFEYLLEKLGIRTTLAGGARAFATAAVFTLFVVLSSSLMLVYNYGSTMQTYIAKPEIREYQKGDLLVAENAKLIRKSKEMTALKAKDRLQTGDEIITGESGTILFQLEKRTLLRLMEKSSAVVIIKLRTKAIALQYGTILCNVRDMELDESFNVTTPNAIIAVTGTQFSVSYGNERTTVSISKGSVIVSNLMRSEEVQVDEGSTAVIDGNDIMPPKDSDNIEIQRLKKIGRLEFMDNVRERSDEEMQELREFIFTPDNETEEEIEDTKEKAEQEEKKEEIKIVTLEDIKRKYGKLEEIQLYNGMSLTGAIISREGSFTIVTVNGIKKIPAKNIKNVRIIK